MNILVATDGILDTESALETVDRVYRGGDRVTVLTAVNMPSEFFRRVGDSGIEQLADIAHEAGQLFSSGDKAAERLAPRSPAHERSPDKSPIISILASTAAARTGPMVRALAARGIEAQATWRTTDNRTARTILSAIRELASDLVIIGSHGRGRFEGLLGSTGHKLVRLSPVPVLVLRGRARPLDG